MNRKLENDFSNWVYIEEGVSQGSVLGRTAFNAHVIYIFIYAIEFIFTVNYTHYPTNMINNRGSFYNPQLVADYWVQMVQM